MAYDARGWGNSDKTLAGYRLCGTDEITPICAVVSVHWGLFRLSRISFVPHLFVPHLFRASPCDDLFARSSLM